MLMSVLCITYFMLLLCCVIMSPLSGGIWGSVLSGFVLVCLEIIIREYCVVCQCEKWRNVIKGLATKDKVVCETAVAIGCVFFCRIVRHALMLMLVLG